MKQKSNKQQHIDRELSKVYSEIDLERDHKCSGCLRWDRPLSHSHLVPRSYKRYSHLVTDKRNITLHCHKCHTIWEDENGIGLFDYEENMAIIREIAPEYYHLRKLL